MGKAVIFDLDGTLLNTIGDLADACNYALKKRGFPLHNDEEYKKFVGWGIKRLVELALPEKVRNGNKIMNEVLKDVADYYSTHWNVKTKPYEGVKDLLKSLNERGIPVSVLSNKPQEFTEETVNFYFDDIEFLTVEGAKGDILKPDVRALKPVFDKLGDFSGKIYFVGDSKTDMETAKNGGIIPVGVSWGFRDEKELAESGAVFVANDVKELEKFLLG